MTILVINGPNLNMLGKRNTGHYGTFTLKEIHTLLSRVAEKEGMRLIFFQSNHEGAIIDFLQKKAGAASGILINPGALTHYGYSLRDALVDSNLPIVEVHASDIRRREEFRKIDVLKEIALTVVMGKKEISYIEGLEKLIHCIKNKHSV